MAQVLTSEGLAEFHATGKVPEFVKPVEPKAAETEPAKKVEPSPAELDDKIEDDQGLTAAERTAYSEKIARKISAKHRALKQAEAAMGKETQGRQAAEKLASDLKSQIAELKKGVPADDGKGPQRKDFASDADWWDAKIDWKAEQKAEAKFTALESRRETERAEAAKAERIRAFAETVDDYDEVIDSLKDERQHQGVIDYMSEADIGPALIYHFGQHPDEYQKLARLKPAFALAELGKIETKLERKADKAETEPAKPGALDALKAPISRAPAPITLLHESASPVPKDPSKMDVDELRVYNQQQRVLKAKQGR